MRVCVFGGSGAFTPQLGYALAEMSGSLPPVELALWGRTRVKVETVAGFMSGARAVDGRYPRVSAPETLEEALDGADIVLNQARIGGYEFRAYCETFPLSYGSPGDETIGPGALAGAMRAIPAVRQLVAEMERVCPRAVLINLTNPCDLLVAAVSRISALRVVGVCDVGVTLVSQVLRRAGLPADWAGASYAGFVHRGWCLGLGARDGDAVFRDLLEQAADDTFGCPAKLIRDARAVPTRYWRYYVPEWGDATDSGSGAAGSRAAELAHLSDSLLRQYAKSTAGERPAALSARPTPWYADAVLPAVAALSSDQGQRVMVITANLGAIGELPKDAVVELYARLSTHGVEPLPVRPLPGVVGNLLRPIGDYAELAVSAVLSGSRTDTLAALLADPLVHGREAACGLLPLVCPAA